MRPGRELDTRIAKEVFNFPVFPKKGDLYEKTPEGERPLRKYSKEIQWAWEVANKMKITVVPIEGEVWFAMAGTTEGWKNPGELLRFLVEGDFANTGAALGEQAPLTICLAALKAIESRAIADAHPKVEAALPAGETLQ